MSPVTKCRILLKGFPIILVLLESSTNSSETKFSFQCVSEATVRKVVKSLPSDTATAGEIPVNVIKNSQICFVDLTNCISKAIRNKKFPDSLKLSDKTPVYKKLDPSDKTNYRSVSVLPLLSKVFGKVIYD